MRELRWLLLLGVVTLELGCGLPDSYYLQPPAAGQAASGLQNSPFTIQGSSRANDINVLFKGYELYYKCYVNTQQDLATLNTDSNYGSSTYTTTDLLQNGFHRVCRGPGSGGLLAIDTTPGTGNAPLIDIGSIDSANLGNAYTITIKVADSFPPTPPLPFPFVITGSTGGPVPVTYFEYFPPGSPTPTAGWEIRRFIQADSSLGNVCRTFANNGSAPNGIVANWTATDIDVTPSVGAAIGSSSSLGIFVMIYAVSYGTGLDGTPRSSYPVWLGYTLINILQ